MSSGETYSHVQRPEDATLSPCSSSDLRSAFRRAGHSSLEIKDLLGELRRKASASPTGWHKQEWEDCAVRCTVQGNDYEWECSWRLLGIAREQQRK